MYTFCALSIIVVYDDKSVTIKRQNKETEIGIEGIAMEKLNG